MGVKDSDYQIVYRGDTLKNYKPGGWVLFQRPKECGGGYWLGRTYDDCFWFEFERPMSLNYGLQYIVSYAAMQRQAPFEDLDDFRLI